MACDTAEQAATAQGKASTANHSANVHTPFARSFQRLVLAILLPPLDFVEAACAKAYVRQRHDLSRLLAVLVVLERERVLVLRGSLLAVAFP